MTALRFDFEWRTTALTVLLLPTLISLGFWQLERAQEKTALALQNERRAAAAPVSLADLPDRAPEALAYRRVRLVGRFLEYPVVFIDNQIRDGRYGHDVINLFRDAVSGETVLLNRGWVPGDPARRSLPKITTPASELTLAAQIYVPPGEPYVLEAEVFDDIAMEVLVQQSNSRALRRAIEELIEGPLFPRELRLVPDQMAGFRRDWPVVNVSPAKHRGYAVQWFTMAAILLLFFAFRSTNLSSVLGLKRRPKVK